MRLALSVLLALVPAVLAQPGAPPLPPLTACGTAAAGGAEILCGVRGPEDIELTPDGKALLLTQFVNANQRAGAKFGIALFDVAKKTYSEVPVTNGPGKAWGEAKCPGPIGDQLGSHGSSLTKRANGSWQYFVTNHGGRQSVEMFELKRTGAGKNAAWGLIWHGCVLAEPGKDYNDVAALPDGSFIATVPTGLQTPGQPAGNLFDGHPSGFVVRWTPGKGQTELPGTRFGYPNGVVATPDGRFAYYAAWTAKEIHKYDLRAGKDVAVTKLDFMPDNITWTQGAYYTDAQLIAAGVKGTRGNCPATGNTPCIMGFGIAQLDPANLKVVRTYDSGEPPLISGVSVALQAGTSVYVGAFQGDRLVRIDWKK